MLPAMAQSMQHAGPASATAAAGELVGGRRPSGVPITSARARGVSTTVAKQLLRKIRGREDWVTGARGTDVVRKQAGGGRRLAVVHGVAVYGGDLWRFWEMQGFIFW